MKISKNWLKDFVEINLSDKELAEKLNKTGTEVEEITGSIDLRVVVGQILQIAKHPNADRLQIATVYDGKEEYQVVCGAPNIAVDQKVPFAKIGAKLPGLEIKEAEIRGVKSFGMLCAPDELGLGEDHSGIMILPNDYEPGKPLVDYLKSNTVFDLEITPNRGDCLSHLGIAREISAFANGQLIKKPPISLSMADERADSTISIDVNNNADCPHYLLRIIKNVKVASSPLWLQEKLRSVGIRPINNVVDATNYIMMDLGQPLHAFDFEKINGKVIVRRAKNREKLLCLDGKERDLNKNILIIADEKNPIAIAGIIGGENSGVTENTVNIVLEAAQFDRKVIRFAKRSLAINTDASYRFERGIDPQNIEYSLNKAADLIANISGGKILSGIVKSSVEIIKNEVAFEYDKIRSFLGIEISDNEVNHILKILGFEIDNKTAIVPTWRHDIFVWQDLAEEVGRIYGYEKVPLIHLPKAAKPAKSDFYTKESIKDELVAVGFTEVKNYSFLSAEDVKVAGENSKQLLEIANPLQPENKYLRDSLLPGLLKNLARNSAFDPVLIFEIGQVFGKEFERTSLGIIASGKDAQTTIERAIRELSEKYNFKKGMLNISELEPSQALKYKIRKPKTFYVETTLEKIARKADNIELKIMRQPVIYRAVSKYPSVTRDLAFVLNRNINPDSVKEFIYSSSDKVNRAELFDEYISDRFGKDQKSLAYHLHLQDMQKTMTDSEADLIVEKIIADLKKEYNAILRDK